MGKKGGRRRLKKKEDVIRLVDWENQTSPYFNDSHRRWREVCKKFVEAEVLPYIDKWEKAGTVPREFYTKAYEAGVYAHDYPKEFGGTPFEGKDDVFHKIILYEQICRAASGGLLTSVWVHGIAAPPVLHFGTLEQKQMFAAVVKSEKLSALAISEPRAGSDVRNLYTTAVKEGDNYIVNGEKYWISGGIKADYFVTAVRTGGPGYTGISLLIIPNGPGVFTTRLPLQGHDCSNTAYVVFRNCKVPCKNLVGKENEGFKPIMLNFNRERFGIAASAVCYARVCLEEAVRYARTRKTFGKRLIDHQVIRHKIADMSRKVMAAYSYMMHVAYCMNKDPLGFKDKSIARNVALFKVQATQTLEFCAREASQVFGGRSYVRGGRGGKVERIYRDVRAYAIYGGSEEIMLDLAMRQAKL